MTIYFIHKEAQIKGPFDITDATGNRIIKIGDICVREGVQHLSVLLVVSKQNEWKSCKCIGHSAQPISLGGNKLLFSFNGINQRKGNESVLEILSSAFEKQTINAFFTNALQILKYECDFWDISIFHDILLSPSLETQAIQPALQNTNGNVTLFEGYLDEDSHHLFTELHHQKYTLKDIYLNIRKQYPDAFRESLKAFLKDHPQATIYDKIP